ncbi:hypothetical protein EW146_g4065 [Bondarzewia mesenterica]|uniref:HpcH/HpaI aldolase/citrate lyase domain-containing protein n=1 Tax=Bondarzewia mesenterica TaxID=1095465 RepID=A0A4S4LVN7_9AGAM|nr:hypothetical protein EW146_g4065 [Bondarzewia mesenterica]
MTAHALLNAFKADKPAFGVWCMLPGAFSARLAAQSSPHLSWVVIDCEHGMTPLQPGAAESIQAIAGIGPSAPSPLVRIPATGATTGTGWQIKYALDAGARGVIVPMVGTAEKAKEVVADCRFPPVGRRGFGSPICPIIWGVDAMQYFNSANDSILVIVQIETPEGVANAEAIAAVSGIDVLFIGPYDLSLSLGYHPPSPDPHDEVEQVIKKLLKVAHSAGKKCGIFCTSGEQAAQRAAQGFDMINVSVDYQAMTNDLSNKLAIAAGQ